MLIERLASLQARHQRSGDDVHVLLLLDLDRFTNFNDARGSEMGDRLLCAVALRLAELLGPHDLLVRVAGTSLALCCTTWASTPPWQAAVPPGVRRPDPASLCAPLALGDSGEEASWD